MYFRVTKMNRTFEAMPARSHGSKADADVLAPWFSVLWRREECPKFTGAYVDLLSWLERGDVRNNYCVVEIEHGNGLGRAGCWPGGDGH